MDLFGYQDSDISRNLLTRDGRVNYLGPISELHSPTLCESLQREINWQPDRVTMFGKTIITKRLYAWHGDAAYCYNYSGNKRIAEPMTDTISFIKTIVEKCTNASFNACLLNLYHDGDEGMGWHADDEPELEQNSPIASVSLGAERRFDFKHKETDERVSVMLEHGSLLVMNALSQKHWLHQLPKTKKVNDSRINLTFRTLNDWTINSRDPQQSHSL